MTASAPQKDYAVIIDFVRTPFAKASAVPVKTGSLRDFMSADEYKAKVEDLTRKHGLQATEVHAILNAPFNTPKQTKENKVGRLAHIDPLDMFVPLVNALLERNPNVKPEDIENVIAGVVHQEGEQGLNLARNAVLHKDCKLPITVQGDTVDKFCASSMRTISIAKNDLLAGEAKLIIAGGVQSMSRIAMGSNNSYIHPKVYDGNSKGFMNMGITAENLTRIQEVTRKEQEEFAVQSHKKAAAAQEAGYFDDEIIPIDGMTKDDCIRADTSVESLAKLRTVFLDAKNGGTVTAGTSSPLTDGATAVLMSKESYARENNLPVLGRVLAYAGAGVPADIMGSGPIEAFRKALDRAGLKASQMQKIESNEAFVKQTLTCFKQSALEGNGVSMDIMNVDGGATALGHPLGASGARLVGHLLKELQRTGERYGAAMMCVGGGQGTCIIVENPSYTIDAPAPAPQL